MEATTGNRATGGTPGQIRGRLESLADPARVANLTAADTSVVADVVSRGPAAGADAERANLRHLKNAFRETTDSGLPFDAVADELVAAGFDRGAVAGYLRDSVTRLDDGYLTPHGVTAARREIEGWLARNGGAK